jgi:Cdc6-like AAA superfamily ATPase
MAPLSGRPLFDNPLDAKLYIRRDPSHERLWRAAMRGLNALLVGDRGAGKTTLLHQLAFELQAAQSAVGQVVIPNLDCCDTAARVLEQVRGAIDGGDNTLVVLDGLDDPGLANTLFGRHRRDLWSLGCAWIASADLRHREAIVAPPADGFFDVVTELEPLARDDQVELVSRRLTPDDDFSAAHLVDVVGDGNPRRLLAAVREVIVGQRPPEAIEETLVSRRASVSRLGRSATIVLHELENLGRPAGASDSELIARLGVTRVRLVQVLNRLEAAGFVESFGEIGPRRGRPRKLYRVRDDRAWEKL